MQQRGKRFVEEKSIQIIRSRETEKYDQRGAIATQV